MQNNLLNVQYNNCESKNSSLSPNNGSVTQKMPTVANSQIFKINFSQHQKISDSIAAIDSKDDDNTTPNCNAMHQLNGVSPTTCQSKTKIIRKGQHDKKRKKTEYELDTLESCFQNDPKWGRNTVKTLKSQLTELTVDQIYKWGYDRKKLLKKNQAQKKARAFQVSKLDACRLEMPNDNDKIQDFNEEVKKLMSLVTSTSEDLQIDSEVLKLRKKRNSVLTTQTKSPSFFWKDTLLHTCDNYTMVEDDMFFYEEEGDNIFFVVTENKEIPHRQMFKGGLFRRPSHFCNSDFYTFQEEAFVKNESKPFGELYKCNNKEH